VYSPVAMDHFLHPRNAGEVAGGARGEAVNAACGDTALFTVRVQDGVVVEAKFRSKGCAGAIACCSAATELLIGARIEEARAIDAPRIASALGGLPESKLGCAEMAAEAAAAALRSAG
jgi:NifU-like protein involved in Fe-S cluster formation